jgi:hypothetical protein
MGKKKSRQLEGCNKFRVINNNARPPGAIIQSPPNLNKPIPFNINKTDDIPNHKLNKDLKVLLKNSPTARRPKKRAGKPPRPQNAFFIYMRDKIHDPKYGKAPKDRVRNIAKEWNYELSEEEKNSYRNYERQAREIHADQYKDYQWFSSPKNEQICNEPDDAPNSSTTSPLGSDSSTVSSKSETEPDSPYASQIYDLPDDDHQYTYLVESRDFELYNPSQIDLSVPLNLFQPSGFF